MYDHKLCKTTVYIIFYGCRVNQPTMQIYPHKMSRTVAYNQKMLEAFFQSPIEKSLHLRLYFGTLKMVCNQLQTSNSFVHSLCVIHFNASKCSVVAPKV